MALVCLTSKTSILKLYFEDLSFSFFFLLLSMFCHFWGKGLLGTFLESCIHPVIAIIKRTIWIVHHEITVEESSHKEEFSSHLSTFILQGGRMLKYSYQYANWDKNYD